MFVKLLNNNNYKDDSWELCFCLHEDRKVRHWTYNGGWHYKDIEETSRRTAEFADDKTEH